MAKEYAKDYTFPKVKFRRVADTPKSRNAHKFFTFWASIPEAKRELIAVRLYRLWPIVDIRAVNPEATIEWDTIRGELPFPPEEYETAFLHRYGSGEWNCVLNEEGVSGVVMECFFSAIDLEQFPPKIDLRTLVRGNFKNQDYVKWLERQPGIQLPWTVDRAQEEEQENMNVAGEAVSKLIESHERQSEKIMDLVEEKFENRTDQESVENVATKEAIKMVTQTAETIVGGMAKQMDKVIEQSGKQVINPTEILETVVNVADKLRGPRDDGSAALIETLLDIQREETKYWRERAEAQAIAAASAPQAEERSDIELLLEKGQQFKQLGDLFGWSTRRSRNDDEPAPRQIEPPKESIVDKLFSKLAENPAVLVTGVFAVTNLIQTVMGRGKPVEEVMATANKVAAGVTAAVEKPAEPSADQLERQRLGNFLRAIEPLLITHFFDEKKENLNGYSFAEDFLTATADPATGQLRFTAEGPETELGQQQYHAIRQGGIAQFDRIIRDYQPLWGLLGGNLAKYQQFLEQFFTYPEAAQRAADERKKKLATVPSQPAN